MNRQNILKWFSRLTGTAVFLFFMYFFIGEGIPDIMEGRGKELLFFLPFCAFSFIGFFLAWFKPYNGGMLMIFGALLLTGFAMYKGNISIATIYALPSFVIGLGFIGAANRRIL